MLRPVKVEVDNDIRAPIRARRRDPLAEPLNVKIRPARPRDRERVDELCAQGEQVHARLLPDYFRESGAETARPAPAGASAIVLVAEAAGTRPGPDPRVIGYVSLRVADTPRDPALTPRRRAYIESIVVEEAVRARGVGVALMQAATQWARQHDAVEMVLTVWSENAPAEALYDRLGYRPIARVLRRTI